MKKVFFSIIALLSFAMAANAQNASPYWSLAGNSNATSSSKLGTTNANSLDFYTNNVQRMIINSAAGYVGIGTATPLTQLHVNGFGSFGNSITTANATRALNLADVNAVMRVLRVHATNAPAVELISRTSADGANVAYWDFYAQPSDASFRIRDRQGGGSGLDRVTISHANGFVGIGTSAPEGTLHVFKGSAGAVTAFPSALVVENSANSYISILAPETSATGILFGKPSSNISGGIIYNDISFNPNGLDFRTNGNVTKMVLNNAGNVGIGTTTPLAKVHISGNGTNAYAGLAITNTNSGGKTITINQGTPGKLNFTEPGILDLMTMDFTSGNVGIGTNAPVYKLSVIGAPVDNFTPVAYIENPNGGPGLYIKAGYNGAGYGFTFIQFMRPDGIYLGAIQQDGPNNIAYTTASDKRLKNIIGASQKGLSDLMKIKIYDYTFKSDPDKKVQTGFMAQELYDVFPQAVIKPRENNEPAEKNPWMVDYGRVTPLIIKAIQEQQPIIEEQKEKIAILEDRINKLEAALAAITAKNGNITRAITDASLEQNNPNPFNKNTIIHYSIPQSSKGQINIYDAAGKLIKTIVANESGQAELSAYRLRAGTYTYSLMVDGQMATSKQMVIMK